MRGSWSRRLGAVALGGLVLVAVARAQTPPPPDPFAGKTAIATGAYGTIQARVQDIESVRADAAAHGQAVRVSCIDEKLKRARANAGTAKVIMDGWALGQGSVEYAQRSLDRLLLLQVYALVYSEEARACAEAKQIGDSLEVKVDRKLPDAPPDDHPDTGRLPHFERPPLASPF